VSAEFEKPNLNKIYRPKGVKLPYRNSTCVTDWSRLRDNNIDNFARQYLPCLSEVDCFLAVQADGEILTNVSWMTVSAQQTIRLLLGIVDLFLHADGISKPLYGNTVTGNVTWCYLITRSARCLRCPTRQAAGELRMNGTGMHTSVALLRD